LRALRRGAQRRSGGLSTKWKFVSGWLVAIVVLDQLTKFIVDRAMHLHQSIPLIDGIFQPNLCA
jgi:lipoprotein signal peptidase